MNKPMLIALEWEDPSSSGGWLASDKVGTQAETGDIVVSVGLLVKETDSHVYLAMDWSKDDETNTRGKIRKELIKKRRDFKLPVGIWTELKYPSKAKVPLGGGQ